MRSNRFAVGPALALAVLSAAVWNAACGGGRAAENYTIEPAHAAVYFKIEHIGISWTYGRFNDVSGKFTIDSAAPAKSTFTLNIKPESVDTGTTKRDDHLRSPDFFNAKQFPLMSFASTQVKPVDGGYAVQGDLTMHGVTKPVSLVLKGGKKAELPPGTQRTGYSTQFVIHRSEFGMNKMLDSIGDEVKVEISFEGAKK